MRNYLSMDTFQAETADVIFTQEKDRRYRIDTSIAGGKILSFGEPGTAGGATCRKSDYLVMDIEHASHDVLVVTVAFGTGQTENHSDTIAVHFGVLPEVHTRLCLPFTALNSETLFLPRYPGTMQTLVRGGAGIKIEDIRSIAIGTIESVSPRSFTLSDVHITDTVPEFPAPQIPFADEMGQYARRSWPGKTADTGELVAYLRAEEQQVENSPFYDGHWGTFGGWKQLQFEATGYFRTHHDGRRWWLADPEGFAFISTGLDCVIPGETMKVDGMENLVSWLPEETGDYRDAWRKEHIRNSRFFSYAIANLIRAFGDQWPESWAKITRRRIREWGFNTVANWSQPQFYESAKMPYVLPLTDFPTTEKLIFRDFPDVFSKEYTDASAKYAEQLEACKGDPLLIGYFLRNEPHWAFVDHLNITEKMLAHQELFESKRAFIEFLSSRYQQSVEQWNKAWHTEFTDFDRLLEPLEHASSLSPQAEKDLSDFNRMMIEQYVKLPSLACKNVDPEHLNLGMRYAWISSDQLFAGSEYFDVFSINMYRMKPDEELIQHISKTTGLPVMIGEFHHGATDVGMLASGIRGVSTQQERGKAYKYYVENGCALPELIGMHYFILNDQALLGRFDGENYQIGAVDVCHRPYEPFIQQVIEAHSDMYKVAADLQSPYAVLPDEIPKTGH
jgi:hypothetical protein